MHTQTSRLNKSSHAVTLTATCVRNLHGSSRGRAPARRLTIGDQFSSGTCSIGVGTNYVQDVKPFQTWQHTHHVPGEQSRTSLKAASGSCMNAGEPSVAFSMSKTMTSDAYDPLFSLIQDDIYAARCIKDLTNLRAMYDTCLINWQMESYAHDIPSTDPAAHASHERRATLIRARQCTLLLLLHSTRLVHAAVNLTAAPILLSLMMHRLFFLPSWTDEPQAIAASSEARELLTLLPQGVSSRPREFSRSLQSAARLHVQLPAHVLAETYIALATGLDGYSSRDVQAVLTAVAKLFPGSNRFDAELDVLAVHLLQRFDVKRQLGARFYATVLWALARIGYQSNSVERLIEAFAGSFAAEGSKELARPTGLIRQVDAEEEGSNERHVFGDSRHTSSADTSSCCSLDSQNSFDLSWLPGGQPDIVVTKPQIRSKRLAAGRNVDIDNVLRGSNTNTVLVAEGRAKGGGADAEDDALQQPQVPALPPGSFVARHGQQTLSNFAWALATFSTSNLDSVDEAFDVCCRLFCKIPPDEVGAQVAGNMAWACNVQESHGVPVLAHVAIAMPTVLRQPSCKPQVAANVLHAMGSARFSDGDALQQIVAWSLPRLSDFNNQECANMAWALARLNHCDLRVFTALRDRVEQYVRTISPRIKADMQGGAVTKARVEEACAVLGQYLWSYSLSGHMDADLFVQICGPLCELQGRGKVPTALGDAILTQVATAWMSLEVSGQHSEVVCCLQFSCLDSAGSDLQLLIAAALAVMKAQARKTARSTSKVYDAVGSVLRVLGIHHQRNVLLGNGLVCIQVLIPQKRALYSPQPEERDCRRSEMEPTWVPWLLTAMITATTRRTLAQLARLSRKDHDCCKWGSFEGVPIAVQVYRGNDLTTSRPSVPIGNAVWLTSQLRARGLRVLEVDGDYWRILTRRQRAAHVMRALESLGEC